MSKTTNTDGEFKDISLAKHILVGGVKVGTLRMREPTVEDTLAISTMGGSEAEKELALFANLCMVSPTELRPMSMRDYKKLQDAYVGFTN